MPLWLWFLIGLGTLIMVWRDHRKEARASEAATYNFPGGEDLKAFVSEQAQAERRANLIAWSPVKASLAFSVFGLIAPVILLDTWGTHGVWMALFFAGDTLFLLGCLLYRLRLRQMALMATVQDDLTHPVVVARAQQSLSLYAPRR